MAGDDEMKSLGSFRDEKELTGITCTRDVDIIPFVWDKVKTIFLSIEDSIFEMWDELFD